MLYALTTSLCVELCYSNKFQMLTNVQWTLTTAVHWPLVITHLTATTAPVYQATPVMALPAQVRLISQIFRFGLLLQKINIRCFRLSISNNWLHLVGLVIFYTMKRDLHVWNKQRFFNIHSAVSNIRKCDRGLSRFWRDKLHWLDMDVRVRLRVFVQVFKCLCNLAFGYLISLCRPVSRVVGRAISNFSPLRGLALL